MRSDTTYLCPKDQLPAIEGSYEDMFFSYIQISYLGCNIPEDDPEGRTCKSPEELEGEMINFVYYNSKVDLRPEAEEDDNIYMFVDFKNFMLIDHRVQ